MEQNDHKTTDDIAGSKIDNDVSENLNSAGGIKQTNAAIKERAYIRNLKARKIVFYIFGVLETLLIIRFILKLLGANPSSVFVSFIYKFTQVFLAPFASIFNSTVANGIVTKSVFEPANLIAIAIYALAAWGIIKLIKIGETSQSF
jgi:hypothetical protein